MNAVIYVLIWYNKKSQVIQGGHSRSENANIIFLFCGPEKLILTVCQSKHSR